MLETETPEEREVFSAMEQSSVRKEGIRSMDKYLSVMEELSVARMLIRELSDRLAKLEKPWVGLTDEERLEVGKQTMLSGLDAFAKAIETKLKEKNT
jgi:hypothetical protein